MVLLGVDMATAPASASIIVTALRLLTELVCLISREVCIPSKTTSDTWINWSGLFGCCRKQETGIIWLGTGISSKVQLNICSRS